MIVNHPDTSAAATAAAATTTAATATATATTATATTAACNGMEVRKGFQQNVWPLVSPPHECT